MCSELFSCAVCFFLFTKSIFSFAASIFLFPGIYFLPQPFFFCRDFFVGRREHFPFAAEIYLLPRGFSFCCGLFSFLPREFLFCRELFSFTVANFLLAMSIFLLSEAFFICRDTCGPPYSSVLGKIYFRSKNWKILEVQVEQSTRIMLWRSMWDLLHLVFLLCEGALQKWALPKWK